MPDEGTYQYPTVIVPPPEAPIHEDLPRTITGAVPISTDQPERESDILPEIVPGFKRLKDITVIRSADPGVPEPTRHKHRKPLHPDWNIIVWGILAGAVLFCAAYVVTALFLAPGLPLPAPVRELHPAHTTTQAPTPSATRTTPSQPPGPQEPRPVLLLPPAHGPTRQSNGTAPGPTPVPTPTSSLPSPSTSASPSPTPSPTTPVPTPTPTTPDPTTPPPPPPTPTPPPPSPTLTSSPPTPTPTPPAPSPTLTSTAPVPTTPPPPPPTPTLTSAPPTTPVATTPVVTTPATTVPATTVPATTVPATVTPTVSIT